MTHVIAGLFANTSHEAQGLKMCTSTPEARANQGDPHPDFMKLGQVCLLTAHAQHTQVLGFRVTGRGTSLLEELVGVGVHQQLVEIVGDAAAILYLRHHVTHSLPRRLARLLRLHL